MSAIDAADLVVVGPAPPLRGGIAAHTARLVEAASREGFVAAALSWRRLYPRALFPGRSQVHGSASPAWSEPLLDVGSPRSWRAAARRLAAGRGLVAVQWWHPAFAPALLAATRGVERSRLLAICHNALPHEPFPASGLAARALLSRCGSVLVHGPAEASRVEALSSDLRGRIRAVALPALLPPPAISRGACVAATRTLAGGDGPVFVVAGHARAYKAVARTMRAWRAARRPPGARLLLVGEWYLRGEGRRDARREAAADPSIVVVDRYVDDTMFTSCLAGADAVVAACGEATQSGTVALAATLGVPCVVSDAGSLPSQVAGLRGARIVPALDEGSLTAALEGLAAAQGSPAEREGEREGDDDWAAARRRFAEDWRRVVEATGVAGRR